MYLLVGGPKDGTTLATLPPGGRVAYPVWNGPPTEPAWHEEPEPIVPGAITMALYEWDGWVMRYVEPKPGA